MILAGLRQRPMSAGELLNYALRSKVPAVRRDDALESLLKRRLITFTKTTRPRSTVPMLIFALAEPAGAMGGG